MEARKLIPEGQLEGTSFTVVLANSLGITHPQFNTQEEMTSWLENYFQTTILYSVYDETILLDSIILAIYGQDSVVSWNDTKLWDDTNNWTD